MLVVLAICAIGMRGDNSRDADAQYWSQSTDIRTILEETLTLNGTADRESTGVKAGNRYMLLTVLPGLISTSPDSYYTEADSTFFNVYFRVWDSGSRKQLLRQVNCFLPFTQNSFLPNTDTNFNNNAASTTIVLANPDSVLVPWWDLVMVSSGTNTGNGVQAKFKVFGAN